jgi:hypothetical protein
MRIEACGMSAERIREAAKVLRDAAERATPGPWERTIDRDKHKPNGIDVGVWSESAINYPVESVTFGNPNDLADAAYIALMSPPVALALADWLDDIEALWASAESMADADGDPLTFGESLDSHALALADAILGRAA